ncbi:hypothetical protein BJX66DRAFT_336882 [Aspergillus keveii]|uniref:Uncharacterized protein n=1 Tax=Aspergillus keveii TaxID=714993 RepID=A0ABR4G946_9EURO
MTKRNITYHILGSTVDLEARKTAKDKEAEEKRVGEVPEYEAQIRFRATQKKSLDHLDSLTRYLNENGFAFYKVYCGYHVEEAQWKVLVVSAKEHLTAGAIKEYTTEVAARFLDAKPDTSVAATKVRDLPKTHMFTFALSKGFTHMTAVGGCEGQAYPLTRDGDLDGEELRAFSKRVGAHDSQFGFVLRFLLNVSVPLRKAKDRDDTTLDKSLQKMRKASFGESYETLMISLRSCINTMDTVLDRIKEDQERAEDRAHAKEQGKSP